MATSTFSSTSTRSLLFTSYVHSLVTNAILQILVIHTNRYSRGLIKYKHNKSNIAIKSNQTNNQPINHSNTNTTSVRIITQSILKYQPSFQESPRQHTPTIPIYNMNIFSKVALLMMAMANASGKSYIVSYMLRCLTRRYNSLIILLFFPASLYFYFLRYTLYYMQPSRSLLFVA